MITTITKEDGRLTISLVGRYDTAASEQAQRDLAPAFYHDDCDIVIDCSQLEYITSSGLRQMLSLYKYALKNGHAISIKGVNDHVRDILRISGFMQLFNIEE